ncbi:MAG: phosphate ABC transporter permease subunit PstC [Acidobacteriota bacterium]
MRPASVRVRLDALLLAALRSCGAISAGVVVVIGFFMVAESWPALSAIGPQRLVTDPSWHPTEDRFNMVPMVLGTLAATAGSLLLTAPLGLGSAVFLRFHAPPRLAGPFRRILEILAGVPSVLYGLWGISVLAPRIAQISPIEQGQSLLAGILILSFMTLPTIALTAENALASVPADSVRGAAARGLGTRAIAWSVAVPAARGGILTGILLQTARALGETMAVLMVCGNIVRVPGSVFDPVRTLTANIALEMGYADAHHRSVLYISGLVLLAMVAALVLLAEWALRRTRLNA